MASIYANSHPAAMGEVVKQGHVDYCRDNGHATYEVDGVDQGYCSRCGESTATPAPAHKSPSTDAILYTMHEHRRTMEGCACGREMFWPREHEEHLAAVIAAQFAY